MVALRSLLIGINLSLCCISCSAFQSSSSLSSITNGRSKIFSRRNNGEHQRLNNGIIGNDNDSDDDKDIVDNTRIERRSFIESTSTLLASSSLVAASLFSPGIAFAEDETTSDNDELIDVYFGCGCVSVLNFQFQSINIIFVSAYDVIFFSLLFNLLLFPFFFFFCFACI
jgi:hypothetical protein